MEKELDMANRRKAELKMPLSKPGGVTLTIKLDKELAALNAELKDAKLKNVLKRLEKKK